MMQPPEQHFIVDRLAVVDRQIERLVHQAKTTNARLELIALLRFVYKELQERPLEFGDPAYHTKKDGGVVCHRVIASIVVHFVVFEIDKVVCILKIAALNVE
jgi:hypothetical protein